MRSFKARVLAHTMIGVSALAIAGAPAAWAQVQDPNAPDANSTVGQTGTSDTPTTPDTGQTNTGTGLQTAGGDDDVVVTGGG